MKFPMKSPVIIMKFTIKFPRYNNEIPNEITQE